MVFASLMKLKNIWPILLILLMFMQQVFARENHTEIMVGFRVNDTCVNSNYADNASRIREIVSFLQGLNNDSTIRVTSISFCGAASPEGSYEWNRRLANGRLSSLESIVRREVHIPDSIISRNDSYIPWNYLKEQVSRSNSSYKDTVMAILEEEPVLVKDSDSGKLVDARIVKLKGLDNRRVWKELFRLYFAKMRYASAVIVTYKDDDGKIESLSIPVASLQLDTDIAMNTEPIDMKIPAISEHKPFFMAVYTNMLYDLLAIPNLGIEFYLGRNWSVGCNYMHAWWSHDRRHRYWRLYGGEINARYWFGKAAMLKPLTGHHIGAYIQTITYDFEFGGKAYMGGEPGGTIFDRAHFGGGVEYGYSLPVGQRLNFDFSIGLGYIGGKVHEFVPDGGRYIWTATKTRHWIGPTKLDVSLVWLIGRGNVNIRKKGGRI